MAVHAHPDDESSKGAATAARYAAEGAEVLVLTCTGGERGDVLNPAFEVPAGHEFESLAGKRAVRRLEMAAAAQALGVQQHWLGFVDSGLPEGDPLPPLPDDAFARLPLDVAAAPVVEAVRRFRPHVITTYDPSGGYPHPDHIYTHTVSMEAWEAAGDASRYVVGGGAEPWTPLKLYYGHGFSLARLRAVHEAMEGQGLESPFGSWIESRAAREIPERQVTTRVRVDQYFPQRDAALVAHASQIDPDGFFFAVPRDVEADVWPWEEYELAASRVPTHPGEDDLFAGIRGTEAAR
ncbi:mycothiol conjugate amidase Mca [Xylanimonas allomyrinae]|uniref:Mycothiol S-conjugate amidase n=1 Tax=Xylanimonas allomyrinae TaxID=2509459 RepID=A0A4P6EK45_9MICO|nr:mycothiol conjugate amidase Mca [Xylanimonas allomyrinae]QAY62003.1 mycothiol conjugate amidase Mca [Xylanimonas allomyrinae]